MGPVPVRESLEIASLSHLAPIPVATRVGPLVTCSITAPFNPGTRTCPPSPTEQVVNLFTHVGNMLRAAGADWSAVAKMTFYAPDTATVMPAINDEWTKHFPDPRSRPSRHCMVVPPDGSDVLVCCDFIAYIQGRI